MEITEGTTFWRVRTQCLDGMRNFMHHSQEGDGSEEIIHQTEIRPRCWHIIRTLKQPGKSWAVVYNGLTVEHASQPCEDHHNFCEAWSFEELEAFGDVR